MYLEFSKIALDNFKTFTGTPTTFPLAHKQPGLHFIRGRNEDEPELGSNGAGKSTIFTALSWCLFGQTINGLRTPDIIPWAGGRPTVVVTWVFKDDKKHTITRATKPNVLMIDGAETGQTEVEQLLGFNFEVFKHTILFGQGQPLFFDLSPKEKMDVFAAALDLDRWERRSEVAKEKAQKLVDELNEIKQNILINTHGIEHNKNLLDSLKIQMDIWEDRRKLHGESIKEQRDTITAKLSKLSKKRDLADLALDGAGTELKALDKEITKLTDAKVEAQNQHNKEDLKLIQFKNEHKAVTRELSGLGKNDHCPTCGQSLKGTNLAKHKRELRDRLETLTDRIKAGIPSQVVKTLEKAASDLAAARTHVATFNKAAIDAQTTLNVVGPEVIRLETQLKELQKQEAMRVELVNPHRAQAQELRKSISKLEAAITELEDEAKLVEQKQLQTSYWVKGFKAVRLFLLEELLQELELATNALLPESGLQDWKVSYDIEKETKKGTTIQGLNLTIQSPNNTKAVAWKSWSGGEGHRLRLVGALALSEVLLSHTGVNTNLEVLDEPTRDLSIEGVQDLCEFLAARAQQLNKDIFLTGHNVIESAHFSSTITVVKKKGAVSYLEDL